MNELDLFSAAIAIPDPGERTAFLDRQCAVRPDLRQRIEQLLDAHFQSNPLLDPTNLNPLREQVDALKVTSDFSNKDELAGTVIGGKYTLIEIVGQGGMGSVWRAKQSEPVKRFVAVKLIKAGMDSKQVLARFNAERQALALMDHPNISKVLDGGLHEQRPFFVMELVKGVPITEYCDKCRLTPQQRLELFVPVCQAIQHAHQKGIIHRDIKPSNVLIALYDDRPVVKVIDFGVAKATGGALTEATIDTGIGAVVGTPQYMSPEQATLNNLDIDTRSDIYALGVLLYELLTGSPPFAKRELEKRGLLEMLRVVREEEPPRPSTKLSTADALPTLSANRGTEPKKLTGLLRNELDWIVMKALEKDRARRYETANGFAADVQRYLSGEAVQAHPPSAGYRMKKFVRRNKGQVIAASLVFFALLAGVIGTGVGMMRATRSAENERLAKLDADEKREKAEKAYARTVDVLDTMVSEVTGDSLATQTVITAEQKKFLTEVLTYYQEFARENADDEKTRRRTAHAAHRVGTIERRLGRMEESAAASRRARDGYAALAAEFPAVPAYRQDLATNQNNLGLLLADLGKRPEAEEQYRKALTIQENLAAEFPAVPDYRSDLARSQHNLGLLLAGLGKRPEAEEQYRKALTIKEKLAADFPAVPNYRFDLARSHNNLGTLLANLGKRPEAEEQFRRALAIREKLAAEFPAVPAYCQDLARSQHNLGILLLDMGKGPEAEERYRKALTIEEKLAAEFPAVPEYRQDFANSHNNLGNLLADLGKRPEAEEQHRKGLAIQEKLAADFPAVPDYREELAASHYNLGALLNGLGKRPEAEEQYRKGLAIVEKLAAEFPAVPAYRQKLAMNHTNLGILLKELGKRPEAEEHYRMALTIQEKLVAEFDADPAYRVNLGGSYCNYGALVSDGGKPADSLEWYTKAIRTLAPIHEQEPRDVTARQFLRNSHMSRATAHDRLQRYAEAIPDWDKAIELSSKEEQPSHLASRAISRHQAGQVAEAVADWEKLLELSPDNPEVLNQLAWPLVATPGKDGRYPLAGKAVEWARRACELAPDNGAFSNSLGVALYRTEQWQPAIDALQKSIKQGADVPHNWLFIAMTYWHLDDISQAQQWYDKSLTWQTANQAAATADKELQSFYAEATKLMATPNIPDPATPGSP